MPIIVKEIKNKADLRTFIYLPEKIHKGHVNWLPPLYLDEEKFFSTKRNPAFLHNSTCLLLAYHNGQPVGRIMGIIPHDFNKLNGQHTARFSYFECFENKDIFDALLQAVEKWAKEHQCNQLIGPMGFSDKEPQGFLSAGFNEPTMIVTNCSFKFMKDFIVMAQYQPYVELCQYEVPISAAVTDRYRNFVHRVKNNLRLKVIDFTSRRQVKPFVRPVFELINTTYGHIYGFTQVNTEEMDEFANRFLPLLNPRLIKVIVDDKGAVVAFIIAMPDLAPGIKKANGRILPFGWYHIFKATCGSKRLQLLLGAIDKDYQNKGLDAMLATALFESAIQCGFTVMDSHLIMRSNHKMRREIERLDGHRMYKEYTIYNKWL